MITAAQLSAGVGITLDITNGSHSHMVNITDADMREIARKGRVSVTSSQNPHSDGSGAHRHTVTFKLITSAQNVTGTVMMTGTGLPSIVVGS